MSSRFVAVTLLPIVAAIFTAYLVIGIAMPVLPLHVNKDLGFGTFVVGLVAGSQFTASLISRFWAGHEADARGPSAPSSLACSRPRWRELCTLSPCDLPPRH